MGILDSLFGGGSSEANVKSPTTTNTTETRSGTGQSYAEGGSTALSGLQLQDNATINVTDLGAVGLALGAIRDNTRSTLAAQQEATKDAVEAFESAQQLAGAVNADQLAKIGLFLLLLLAGGFVYVGSRKQ